MKPKQQLAVSNLETSASAPNIKLTDVSPVIRKRTDGKVQYHHGPSRSFGGLNTFQQQMATREIFANGNRKDSLVKKSTALLSALENREVMSNSHVSRHRRSITIYQLHLWLILSSQLSNPFEKGKNDTFENVFANTTKQATVKKNSFERNDSSVSTASGNTSGSPFMQNLKTGLKPSVQSNQMNTTNNGFGNTGFGVGNTIQTSVIAKRGTVVDDDTIKSFANLQNSGLKNSGIGLNEWKNLDKPNSSSVEETKIVTAYSFKTKAGALPNKSTKTNQDAYIVHQNLFGNKNNFLFAVCDGHGVNGHHASGFVKQNLARNIEYHLKSNKFEEDITLKNAISQGFLQTNKDLSASSIDVSFSGSTTISVLVLNDHIVTANVGDSRAIMAKFKSNQWIAYPLSTDHKPDEKREKERIIAAGGRVEAFNDYNGDPIGPARVWLKNDNVPGLAMARSIGDSVAAQVGVIPDPEIMDWYLQEEDKFMVIASDGVWEFLSNEQVVNYVVPFYLKNQLDAACDKLIKESTTCWKQEDEVVDDITCIIVTFKTPPKN